MTIDIDHLRRIAFTFVNVDCNLDIKEITNGLINKTYLVSQSGESEFSSFILQRVNQRIFSRPLDVISNYLIIEESILLNTIEKKAEVKCPLVLPKLLLNYQTNNKYLKKDNCFWRAFEYVPSSISFNNVNNSTQVSQCLESLWQFHCLTSSVKLENLKVAIPNFHDTPYYLNQFNIILKNFLLDKKLTFKTNRSLLDVINYAKENHNEANLIQKYFPNAKLKFGVTHGDPKFNNFLFNTNTCNIVSLIDLDTCQPGYIIYDLADCIRSLCNPAGEESHSIGKVEFNLDFYYHAINAYFIQDSLSSSRQDLICLPYAIRTITFELAIRFLTDYLQGNPYFDITYPNQNLNRSEIQFNLLESIKSKWANIIMITNDLAKKL
ncbi:MULTISPECIES: phosphotransferase enzyme family protein [unclassified Prochlorococcus]|uniref:phosphotransferase enzyme family protein n=1 Tax=unclassified Prochlorococcus TaxID=2627481 RepID=UPI000533A5F9|nr:MULTISPECIES: aminoglycoside phosphotransferase family protein [unclassified Prochlorococcus]KGG15113.1 Homoserine/choline kinase family protein [Prochlorococcus sp. MIT 0602]KGG17385.1 Homoserine/choline kinase family protein [Prochlorococcus sp. MIT 0603]